MTVAAENNSAKALLNKAHVLANFAGSAIPTFITIASIPILIHEVGPEKYGTLVIVWLVFGYFGLLDFGISRAVTNSISKIDELGEQIAILWTAIHLTAIIGIVIAILGLIVIALIDCYTTTPWLAEIKGALPWLALGMPLVTITATLNGALDGIEKFKDSNLVQIFGSVLYQLSPLFCAIYVSNELTDLIASVILARLCTFAAAIAITNYRFPFAKNYSFSSLQARSLIRFGSSIAGISVFDLIFSRLDQLIVAEKVGSASVAAYNVAMNATVKLSMLPIAMSRSVFPRLSNLTLEDARSSAIVLHNKLVYVWTLACMVAVVSVEFAFNLWLPDNISGETSRISEVLIVGLWVNCLSIIPYTTLQAQGKSNKIIRLHLIEAPFFCVVLYYLINHFNAAGAALAFVIRNVIDYVLLWLLLDRPLKAQILFFCFLIVLSTTSLLKFF